MIPISLLVAHFVGDFLLQSDWMATNKSKSWIALGWHTWVYATTILAVTLLSMPIELAGPFWTITLVTHFITDAITSRITSKLWFFRRRYYNEEMPYDASDDWYYIEGRRHWFFVMIGFDQLIHYITLIYTWRLLV